MDHKKAGLLIVITASFLTPFMLSSVNVALPLIAEEFSMDAVLLNWVATSFLLAAAIFLVPVGRVADIYGRKKIFSVGVLLYTVSSLLCGIATSPFMLLGSRVLQGVGSAMVFGTTIAILTSIFSSSERGKVLGINVASVYLGLSLGPFLGGVLSQNLGWRSIFLVNVPLGVLIMGLVVWRLEGEWAEARGEKFDLRGSLLYALALVVLMTGFSFLPQAKGALLVILGVGGILSFVFLESRHESPVLNIELFSRNRVFALSNLIALINYSATFAVTFLMSLYLQYIKALPPQTAGLVLVTQPVIMAIFSPFTGKLSDRSDPGRVVTLGLSLTFAGVLSLSFLGKNTTMASVMASLLLLGAGFAFFSSPNTNAIMSSVAKKYYGVASGMVGTMRLVGQMLSMGIAMVVFAVYMGRVEITPDQYPLFLKSVRATFSILSFFCLGGIGASLIRGRVFRPEDR